MRITAANPAIATAPMEDARAPAAGIDVVVPTVHISLLDLDFAILCIPEILKEDLPVVL